MGKGIATAGQHNYQADVLAMLAAGLLGDPGPGTFRLVVCHADDCGIWRGATCNCSPTFELSTEVG